MNKEEKKGNPGEKLYRISEELTRTQRPLKMRTFQGFLKDRHYKDP